MQKARDGSYITTLNIGHEDDDSEEDEDNQGEKKQKQTLIDWYYI